MAERAVVETRSQTLATRVHRLRPFPALDGLRGLAVAAVVLFHYPTRGWVEGGLFGVDVFFVLSGFLVTAGLLDEAFETGSVRVRAFLVRRAQRLVPALIALLVVFVLFAVFFRDTLWFASNPFGASADGPQLPMHRVLNGVIATLTYGYNTYLIHAKAAPLPLGHLWTLAIEGQFYVGWVLLVRWVTRRFPRAMLPVTMTLIAASACQPWFIWHGGTGANAIYFGTVPRLQQLLAGALVAQLWRQGWFDRIPIRVLRFFGLAGAITLATMCFTVSNVTFKYLGAETVTAVATAAVVAFLVTGPSRAPSSLAMGVAPLAWLGRRSYGVYLWHWPLAVWTNRFPHEIGVPLGIGLSLVLDEGSWRLIERPIQRRKRRPRPADGDGAGGRREVKLGAVG